MVNKNKEAEVAAGSLHKEPSWVRDDPSRTYFLEEWQKVPRTQQAMFEHLCLLVFQNGLGWSVVLGKREAISRHFKGFSLEAVASLTEHDISQMLSDTSMIRNEAKIRSCIANAQALLHHSINLPALFEQAFDSPVIFDSVSELPRTLETTNRIADDLKDAGAQRAGQVVCCALAQATGFIRLGA